MGKKLINYKKQPHMVLNHPPLVDATYEQLFKLIRDEFLNSDLKEESKLNTFYKEIIKLRDMEEHPVKYLKSHAKFFAPNIYNKSSLNFLKSLDDEAQLSYEELVELRDKVYEVCDLKGLEIPIPLSKEDVLRKKKSILRAYYVFLEFEKNGYKPFDFMNVKQVKQL